MVGGGGKEHQICGSRALAWRPLNFPVYLVRRGSGVQREDAASYLVSFLLSFPFSGE